MNIPRRTQMSVWRGATHALWGAVVLAVVVLAVAVLLGWHRQLPDLEDFRWRMLLTLLGVAGGAWVARPIIVASRRFPLLVTIVGMLALGMSQVCYYILIWGTFKSSMFLWRAWWMSLVIAIAVGHSAWVRLLIAQPNNRRWVTSAARTIWICTTLGAMLVIGLALGKTPLPETHIAYQLITIVPLMVGGIGTIVLAIRAWKLRSRQASPTQKIIWGTVGVAAAMACAFYIGRITAPVPTDFDAPPAMLAHLSHDELEAQLDADLKRLQIVTAGIDELAGKADVAHARFNTTRKSESRDYYRPAEEDEIRAMFMSYLAYRAALLRMAATYAGFETIPDPAQRTRAFLIGYCAGSTVMDASQRLVATYRSDPAARRKLNEADTASGIPAGTFDRIYSAVTNSRNVEKIQELAAYFQTRREHWRANAVIKPEEFAWLDTRINTTLARLRENRIDANLARVEQLYDRVKRDVYSPMYASQSVISTLIGDTRMVSRAPFISIEQVKQVQSKLRPGDICLERRNWFMSNAFLPGFWPHAALYIGTIEDLEKLGLVQRTATGWTSNEPAIRDHLDELVKPAEDGEPHTILESVSEGVIFNSLTHSMHADYVAVLRPRKLSDADRARAIVRAFSHLGKPYDFEFDFFSADKLVCTELVYRSYDGMIKFDLVPIMGRSTLPALEIARKFTIERSADDRELDFVLFLDALPKQSAARLATAEDFCSTLTRPRGFNE